MHCRKCFQNDSSSSSSASCSYLLYKYCRRLCGRTIGKSLDYECYVCYVFRTVLHMHRNYIVYTPSCIIFTTSYRIFLVNFRVSLSRMRMGTGTSWMGTSDCKKMHQLLLQRYALFMAIVLVGSCIVKSTSHHIPFYIRLMSTESAGASEVEQRSSWFTAQATNLLSGCIVQIAVLVYCLHGQILDCCICNLAGSSIGKLLPLA